MTCIGAKHKITVLASLLVLFLLIPVSQTSAGSTASLINLTYRAGQIKINCIASDQRDQALSVKLVRDGKPVSNEHIHFIIVDCPGKAREVSLTRSTVSTDQSGVATTSLTLGKHVGLYKVAAFCQETAESPVIFEISVLHKFWLVFIVLSLLGGLAIFLFGMFFMSDNLQRMGAKKLRKFLAKYTSNRVYGVLVGTLVTAVIQSSSATTIMVVGLINSGLMNLVQSIGVILGANIGTTITAQIVAFKLTDYAVIFVALGFFIRAISKKKRNIATGNMIIGFGLLFLGLKIMTDVTKPLRTYQPFIDLMVNLENPLIGVLVGALFTGIIRSSSAATGVYIALAFQGLLTLESSIPLILGANIGTSTNALIASLGANRESKRAALIHIIFNMSKVVVFLPLIGIYRDLIYTISPHPVGVSVLTTAEQIARYAPRQIANAHSIAKIIAVIAWLPFTPYLGKLATWLIPVREDEKHIAPKYLDEKLLKYPEMALELAKKEILRMSEYVEQLLDNVITIFETHNIDLLNQTIKDDQKVDVLYKAVKPYIAKLIQEELGDEQSLVEAELMIVAEELENFGDVISKSLLPSTFSKMIEYKLTFSSLDTEHIIDFFSKNKLYLHKAMEAFKNDDFDLAEKIIKEADNIDVYYKALHIAHLQKYSAGVEETIRTSTIYMSILAGFKQLFSLIVQIAQAVVELGGERKQL